MQSAVNKIACMQYTACTTLEVGTKNGEVLLMEMLMDLPGAETVKATHVKKRLKCVHYA